MAGPAAKYANVTLTPDHERCPSEVTVGGLRLRCGTVTGHPGPHGGNLTDDRAERTAYVNVQWITEPDDRAASPGPRMPDLDLDPEASANLWRLLERGEHRTDPRT